MRPSSACRHLLPAGGEKESAVVGLPFLFCRSGMDAGLGGAGMTNGWGGRMQIVGMRD